MEKKTMGSFMSALRKANGLTQQQVADILNVSNKTVSKWERDDGYPEITLLPAIAELYSVTVDELLRGERIVGKEQATNIKSEKQAESLFKIAFSKYSTLSVVSLIVCFLALLILIPLWPIIGIVLAILLIGVAVIIEFVAFMNFRPVLEESDGIINADLLLQTKIKLRRFLVAISSLSVLILFISVFPILLNMWEDGVVVFLSVIVLATAGIFLYRFIGKKLSLDLPVDTRYISFRKKSVVAVVVFTVIAFAASVAISYVQVYIEGTRMDKYEFRAAEYLYADSETAAKEDYYKLKNHFTEGAKLYYLHEVENMSVVFCEIKFETSEYEDGFAVLTGATEEYWDSKIFETQGELEAFVRKYTVNEGLFHYVYESAQNSEKIIFDDKKLQILTGKSAIDWQKAHYYMDDYMFISAGVSAIVGAGAILLCMYKKKNLKKFL